jgi:CheY-like chemotaxis protein
MVILVVEDVDDTRELMKLLLELHGHEVDTAANGEEAIRAATQRVPSVILMDLSMPVMDGFAATRALRLIPETCDVPIIAVSAYVGDKEWCDKAKAAGCNECIGKPIDLEALDDVLRRFVSFA